jgi:hypothetical protein
MSHPDKNGHNLISKLINYAFFMMIKEVVAFSDERCNTAISSADTSSSSSSSSNVNTDSASTSANAPISAEHYSDRYVSPQQFDQSLVPLCSIKATDMKATESPLSYNTFLPSNLPDLALNHNIWSYYNDSKSKYGWILETNKTVTKSICDDNDRVWCDKAAVATTITFDVDLQKNFILQVSYLKSHPEKFGSARLWIDDFTEYAVDINGKQLYCMMLLLFM